MKNQIRVRDRLVLILSIGHVVLVLGAVGSYIAMILLGTNIPQAFEKLLFAIAGDFVGYCSSVAAFYFRK